MRLFVAVDFSQEIKEVLWNRVGQLKDDFPQVSWVGPENIHLTLKFLGGVESRKLPEIKKAITESIKNIPPFKLTFTDFGYFDKSYLVIWLGVEPVKTLKDLVKNIERETRKLGFSSEKRAYFPHVTFGRGKNLTKPLVTEIKEKIKKLDFSISIDLTVFEIVLMQSTLSPQGAFYKPLARFALS